MSRRFSPWWLKTRINWMPPFLGAGIRVRRVSPDYREIVVDLPLAWYNRGYHGTHLGGSLYAMCDPFFALMVVHNLPSDYVVWDKAAAIDFVAPGRTRVSATFKLSDDDLTAIRKMTADGARHLHVFRADVVDVEGLVVARVEKVVYVRTKRKDA